MEGVKGVKGGLARAWPVGLDGLTLLKGVDSPGVRNRWAPTPWDSLLRFFCNFVALHFFIVFSMPLLIDFGSFLPPNLAPKIHQNR